MAVVEGASSLRFDLFCDPGKQAMMVLVTGEIGCGKTTACKGALDLLQRREVVCMGILSPPRLDESGAKIGIDVQDVATGERRPLADFVTGGGETIGNYTFDTESLSWAIARLQTAVTARRDLFVMDEIGPLELVHQRGFVAVLSSLADADCVPHGLAVVRQEYAPLLEGLMGRSDVRRFRIERSRREHLPVEIADAFAGAFAIHQHRAPT